MTFRSTLILTFVINAFPVLGQQEVLFKKEFRPGKTYEAKVSTTSVMEMDFLGDEEMINKLKSSGVSLPVIMKMDQLNSMIMITGPLKEDDFMPITVVFDKMVTNQIINGVETIKDNPLANVKMEGRANTKGELKIDSIHGDIKPELKALMSQVFQNIQKQVIFPENPLKVGDHFSQEIPMTIPLAGNDPIKIKVKIDYVLKRIENQAAIFDLKQELTLDFSVQQGNASATGSGTGPTHLRPEGKLYYCL